MLNILVCDLLCDHRVWIKPVELNTTIKHQVTAPQRCTSCNYGSIAINLVPDKEEELPENSRMCRSVEKMKYVSKTCLSGGVGQINPARPQNCEPHHYPQIPRRPDPDSMCATLLLRTASDSQVNFTHCSDPFPANQYWICAFPAPLALWWPPSTTRKVQLIFCTVWVASCRSEPVHLTSEHGES